MTTSKKFVFFIFCIVLSVSAKAQIKLDRFESTIIEFEKEDRAEGFQPEAILFTGSSSIRRWETLLEDMSPIPVINRGFGGSTIPEVLHYADRIILPHQPKMIVLYCGENDLANDEAKAKLAFKSFKKFHNYIIDNLPDTRVYFIAIKPSIKREKYWPKMQKANQMIRRFIKRKKNFYYLDTSSIMLDENGHVLQDIFIKDDLHLNKKGYQIWIKTIKPILERDYVF
jgi:lysophospholipase L1-like esterase